jgi:DNA excision repair protein ERCC-1
VAWRYGDIEPDFIVGAAAAALYISVQYHLLHPNYLKSRLVGLSGKFRVRILLVHVVRLLDRRRSPRPSPRVAQLGAT